MQEPSESFEEPEALSDTTDNVTKPATPEIALCLSGGGYRAALFHLGVLRCLHEMGILQSVAKISSVSGGSIISSYIARLMFDRGLSGAIQFQNWETDVAAAFRAFVKNDIRTGPALKHLAWNWKNPNRRVRSLQSKYDELLLTVGDKAARRSMLLSDLPKSPKFVFCATDLTFGVNFEFKLDKTGDFQLGYANKNDWPVAMAVAASSCFPPVFGPFKLDLDPTEFRGGNYRNDDRALLASELSVTDGGVYDNLGFEPVKKYNMIIASDGGSPFGYMGSAGIVKRLMRNLPVMMNQVASLRKRIFFTSITKGWHDGAYIDISHERTTSPVSGVFDGYVDKNLRAMIAAIRTDLDTFSDAEARILENHGYFETYRRITGKLPALITNKNFQPVTPHPEWESCTRAAKALEHSDKRKFFFIRL